MRFHDPSSEIKFSGVDEGSHTLRRDRFFVSPTESTHFLTRHGKDYDDHKGRSGGWKAVLRYVSGVMPEAERFITEKAATKPAQWRWKLASFVDSCLRGASQVVLVNNPVSGIIILLGLFIGNWHVALGATLGLYGVILLLLWYDTIIHIRMSCWGRLHTHHSMYGYDHHRHCIGIIEWIFCQHHHHHLLIMHGNMVNGTL